MSAAFAWYDAVGLAGVVLMLAAYLLLTIGRVRSDSLGYSLANGVGAALVLVSLYYAYNLSAVVIETAWLLIAIYGIVRALRGREPAA